MLTIAEILMRHGKAKGALIPILQEIQDNLGYLTPDAIFETAKFTGISESEIYGVASFYSLFYFTPRGKHTVKVCLGTTCHVLLQTPRNSNTTYDTVRLRDGKIHPP